MAYLAVVALALLESLAVVGLVVPGTAGVAAAGAAAQAGRLAPWAVMLAAIGGAIVGDALSYVAGCNLHAWKRLAPWFDRHAVALERTHRFVERWGVAALVVARFSGPAHGFAPLVAGAAGMPVVRYALANVVGAVAWSVVVVTAGSQIVAAWRRVPHEWFAAGVAACAAAYLAWWLVAQKKAQRRGGS